MAAGVAAGDDAVEAAEEEADNGGRYQPILKPLRSHHDVEAQAEKDIGAEKGNRTRHEIIGQRADAQALAQEAEQIMPRAATAKIP